MSINIKDVVLILRTTSHCTFEKKYTIVKYLEIVTKMELLYNKTSQINYKILFSAQTSRQWIPS